MFGYLRRWSCGLVILRWPSPWSFSFPKLYVLEKAMAPHSSTLAWKSPWMEELGRLQSMGSRRVGHDSDFPFTFHFSLSCIGEGNGNPLQCSCLENPRHGGAWWASVYGVAQSRTRLKRLSSSSSSKLYVYVCVYVLFVFLPTHFYLLCSLHLWSTGEVPGPPYFSIADFSWFFFGCYLAHLVLQCC